jgi:hypothetical protein
MTELTYAILPLLMFGIAVSLPTTTDVMTSGVATTSGLSNTTSLTITTPMPSDTPASDVHCGFMFGGKHHVDDSDCTLFMMQDYGFVACLISWVGFYGAYTVFSLLERKFYFLDIHYKWTLIDQGSCFLLLLSTLIWEAVFVVIFVYYVYCYYGSSTPPAVIPAALEVSKTADPVVVVGGGMVAHYNQRFPKIAPGDCRPKYTRVQTNSAC